MISVGFTGTRGGLKPRQREALIAYLMTETGSGKLTVHHGDCTGADEEFHDIAKQAGATVEVHPPNVDTYQAWCQGDVNHVRAPYLARNRDIVDACNWMIACPNAVKEKKRGSGTWYTVRYARAQGKRITLIFPDGSIRIEGKE